jgi:hypothetical protein
MATAAGRVAAWAQSLQLAAVGQFGRYWEARARGEGRKLPPGRCAGDFAAEELAMELVTSPRAAYDTLELASDLQDRLPATSAALAGGLIDPTGPASSGGTPGSCPTPTPPLLMRSSPGWRRS